jgi:hypothetical protein
VVVAPVVGDPEEHPGRSTREVINSIRIIIFISSSNKKALKLSEIASGIGLEPV